MHFKILSFNLEVMFDETKKKTVFKSPMQTFRYFSKSRLPQRTLIFLLCQQNISVK